jgi:hypothetical protein
MAKLDKFTRFVPGLYKPSSNENVRGLLYAWAGEDDDIVQAVIDAKEQLFVQTAQLQYLDSLGSNVGVFRPTAFQLADEQYRLLIPALSFAPKQVRPTIIAVLNVFFGVGNPLVQVFESNPNEIAIQIPSSVPSLRRSVRGSLHLKAYSFMINSIDNTMKTMTVNTYNDTKVLKADELSDCTAGQDLHTATIIGNSAGTGGVTIQFGASSDLSGFQTGRYFVVTNPNYPSAYINDSRRAYSVTKDRGVLGQNLKSGQISPHVTMQDSSNIPDSTGYICFNFGFNNEEGPIKYFSRPNNSTLQLDPSYVFTKNHTIGETVNVVVPPYQTPDINGYDYRPYLVGVTAARLLAQSIVQEVLAAGIVIRWIVVSPNTGIGF